MRMILLLMIVLSGAGINAQSCTLDSLGKASSLSNGDVHIRLPGWLIRAGVKYAIDDSDASDILMKLRKGLGTAEILVLEDRSVPGHIAQRIHNDYMDDGYETYMQVREGNQFVNILFKEEKEKITRMLITVNDTESEFVAISMKTKLSHDDLALLINENL